MPGCDLHPYIQRTTNQINPQQVAKEVEKHVGLAGRFVGALRHEIKKDMEKFAPKK